jgi:hypothetical protein
MEFGSDIINMRQIFSAADAFYDWMTPHPSGPENKLK